MDPNPGAAARGRRGRALCARLKAAPDEIVQMYEPKKINVMVVGGETQGAWKMFGANYVKTVSVDSWR